MKAHIYPIVSPLHDSAFMDGETKRLLGLIQKEADVECSLVDIDHLYDGDLAMVLVESGGSEQYFLEVREKLREPILLLTFGNSNSLAASMEILTYVQSKGQRGEILHGSDEYIVNRIKEILRGKEK